MLTEVKIEAEFFGALSAMDEADEIKLTAHLDEKGQLVFDKPEVKKNRVSRRNSVS